MRKGHGFFALFFVIMVVLSVSGCKEDCSSDFSCPDRDQLCIGGKCTYKKCDFNTDCEGRKCFSGRCSDGRCSYETTKDCCGNNVCESDTEDICSCPADCRSFEGNPSCEGAVEIGKTRTGTPIYTEYIGYSCRDSDAGMKRCLLGINEGSLKPQTLLDTKSLSGFTLQTKIRYNDPFEVNSDNVEAEFTLKDISEYVKPPVRINEVRIMSDEQLLGLRQANIFLNTVGSTDSIMVPFDTVLKIPEEEWRLKLEVDYQYTKLKGAEEELLRSTYVYSIGKAILVDTEG